MSKSTFWAAAFGGMVGTMLVQVGLVAFIAAAASLTVAFFVAGIIMPAIERELL